MDALDIRLVARGFFDSDGVMRRLAAGERRVLSKYGAWVRTAARSSIRKRKRYARPGEPPSSHEGSLRRLLYFAYEPATHSVVIGPALFRGKTGGGKYTVPELLEYGGRAAKEVVTLGGGRTVARDSPLGRKSRGSTVRVVADYKGNPFMVPAAAKVGPRLAPELGTLLG